MVRRPNPRNPKAGGKSSSMNEIERPTAALSDHVDEPQQIEQLTEVFNRVVVNRQPVVIRRDGLDFAAVITMEHFELLQQALAWQEAEKRASEIDWHKLAQTSPPSKEWFEGHEPKPF